MVVRTNSFDLGLSNGTTITSANTLAGGNQFSLTGSATSFTQRTGSDPFQGAGCARATYSNTTSSLYFSWDFTSGITTRSAWRFYFKRVSGFATTNGTRIFSTNITGTLSNTSNAFAVQMNSSGQVRIYGNGSSLLYSGTAAHAVGTWYRIEVAYLPGAAGVGSLEFRSYVGDSLTPFDTYSNTSTAFTYQPRYMVLGRVSVAGSSAIFDLDAMAADTDLPSGFIGPVPANTDFPVSGTTAIASTTSGAVSKKAPVSGTIPIVSTTSGTLENDLIYSVTKTTGNARATGSVGPFNQTITMASAFTSERYLMGIVMRRSQVAITATVDGVPVTVLGEYSDSIASWVLWRAQPTGSTATFTWQTDVYNNWEMAVQTWEVFATTPPIFKGFSVGPTASAVTLPNGATVSLGVQVGNTAPSTTLSNLSLSLSASGWFFPNAWDYPTPEGGVETFTVVPGANNRGIISSIYGPTDSPVSGAVHVRSFVPAGWYADWPDDWLLLYPSGTITRNAPVSGTTAIVSGTSGTVSRSHAVSGTVAVASTTSGAVSRRTSVAGTTAIISTTAGAVTSRRGVSGSVAAVTTTTGSVTRVVPVSGTTAAVSTTSGAVTLRAAAAGTTAIVSTTSGTVTRVVPVSGTTPIVSTTSGAVGARVPVSGQVVIVSTTSGAITVRRPVSGTVVTTSGTTGAVTLAAQISGQVDIIFTTTGNPVPSGSLSGETHIISTTSGAITAKVGLSGTTTILSGTSGAVTLNQPVSGTTAITSGTSGTVAAKRAVSGVTPIVSTTAGAVTSRQAVVGDPTDIVFTTTGTADGGSTASGTTNIISGTSGSITVNSPVAGQVNAVSTTSGSITANIHVVGVTDIVFTTSGWVEATVWLSGTVEIIFETTGRVVDGWERLPRVVPLYAVHNGGMPLGVSAMRLSLSGSGENLALTGSTSYPELT